MSKLKRIPFLILPLLWVLLSLPLAGLAATGDPVAEELKKKAQQAFVAGHYAEAAASNLEIAMKHPDSEARRYAVQMLGTLYENNLVDIRKAVKWHREFLDKYADPRQAPFYKEKLASLEKLQQQKQDEEFATYQSILFANKGDEVMVEKFEALLAKYPDFLLKAKVQRELGHAYARLDKRRESYQAFQDLSKSGGAQFSADDRTAFEKAGRHWLLTKAWGGIAWGIVAILWAAALLMKPWERMTRASLRTFMIWAVLWLLLSAVRIPSFHALNSSADAFIFPDATVYILAALNVPVLFWLWLLTRGTFWQTRPRALRWASPPLTLVMTTAVLYLFLIYQPNGTEIMDAFAAKYRHWAGEWQKSGPVRSSVAGEAGR